MGMPAVENQFVVRNLHPGMGQAVAERTVLRKKENGKFETWADVADRVAVGNSLLANTPGEQEKEYESLKHHLSKATLLMSGRHLQHGDKDQPTRNMEVFTNCATSATSFILFYLLLNGSGVGRCYDDDMMLVNWDNAPQVRCVLDESHPDFDWSAHESVRDAKHKYGMGKDTLWFEVPDSREGWAKALEIWENAAFEKIHKDKTLVLDFSKVRERGQPIGGMQSRPASGPVPLMNAFAKAASLKGSGMSPWRQTMYLDHYFAECVLVGGARRAARMSTKYWKDRSVLGFITVKRPIEYDNKKMDEILDIRASSVFPPMGFLWSSNNSVSVDKEFWHLLDLKKGTPEYMSDDAQHARKVFRLLTEASYADGTGEPGLINVDKLVQKDEGWEDLNRGDYVGSKKFQIEEDTQLYLAKLARKAKKKKHHTITNPCGEIALNILGGYCVIADVVPYHADTLDEAEDAFRVATRALMRVNKMDSLYVNEVERTNRIGVGLTGVHEFAWKFFKVGFKTLINPNFNHEDVSSMNLEDLGSHDNKYVRAAAFWLTMAKFNKAVRDEATKYAKKTRRTVPHTMLTIKPAGTTSKLFGLTEGWHLPAMAWFVRWVQFRSDDPLVQVYKEAGYPLKDLRQYSGTTVVGFPTEPTIAALGMGDELTFAGEATPEEQYKWLMLGEKYWIRGFDDEGNEIKSGSDEDFGNQISYTLKYEPDVVDYKQFKTMLDKYQREIRCCSVMPQIDVSSYEYQPEEPVTKVEYEAIARSIGKEMAEDIGKEHVDCLAGACPVDFNIGEKE